ncbi:MAG: hypothetical protein AAGE96_23305 [Cyanobacteria bacterium P01_G01_bin.19]
MSSIVNPTIPEITEPLPNGGLEIRGFEDRENILEGSENSDSIIGGNNNDILEGGAGNDTIAGGAGNDEIFGGVGNDVLSGEEGNDTIRGGVGENVLTGGEGNDVLTVRTDGNFFRQGSTLTGGEGEDVFRSKFNQGDGDTVGQETFAVNQITDFTPGEDRLVIQGLQADGDPVYDSNTGILSVDDVEIAQLSAGLNINEEDIEIADNSSGGAGEESAVYRFYDSLVGAHFYTADEVERDSIQDNLPNYQFEGESYRTADRTTGAQEVYRFFNPSTGVHLYTTDELERDSIIANLPNFEFEGVKFYAYETEVEGSIPVYRFYEPTLGVHFYTPDEVEKDAVSANLSNYNFEGIAYYALPVDEDIL